MGGILLEIKTVTVLGANGTMGCNIAGIFASFGNAKVYMACRTLEKAEKAKIQCIKSIRAEAIGDNLVPVDYSQLPVCIAESDLIFESVSERLDIKQGIIDQIAPHVRADAILATGTSGLSINRLAMQYPDHLRSRFIGMHFFNPPYMMTLCEIIDSEYTDKEMSAFLSKYSDEVLVRAVVNVADLAAFLGNRIGFQFINEACQFAETYKDAGGIDYIDALFGGFTGRNMAPIATADFVGLDTSKAIVDNLYEETADYARDTFIAPAYMQTLIDQGKLGRKVKEGFYKMVVTEDGKKVQYVYDIASGDFRVKNRYAFPFAKKMAARLHEGDYTGAFDALVSDDSTEADLCLTFLIKYVLYSMATVKVSSPNDLHAADAAMATGFGWVPPLAVADAFGGKAAFIALAKKRLPAELSALADEILGDMPEDGSHYDYRAFFKGRM